MLPPATYTAIISEWLSFVVQICQAPPVAKNQFPCGHAIPHSIPSSHHRIWRPFNTNLKGHGFTFGSSATQIVCIAQLRSLLLTSFTNIKRLHLPIPKMKRWCSIISVSRELWMHAHMASGAWSHTVESTCSINCCCLRVNLGLAYKEHETHTCTVWADSVNIPLTNYSFERWRPTSYSPSSKVAGPLYKPHPHFVKASAWMRQNGLCFIKISSFKWIFSYLSAPISRESILCRCVHLNS